MKYNFLASALEHTTIPDSFLIALVGMVVIFVVLAILILILMGFEHIFQIKWLRDDYVKPVKNKNNQQIEPLEDESVNNDEEIVAISAALMCYFDSENKDVSSEAPFRIRNIKRIK